MSEAGSTKRSHMDQEFSNCSITAIHKQIKSVKNHRQRRKKTCIKHRLQKSNDLDFSTKINEISYLFCLNYDFHAKIDSKLDLQNIKKKSKYLTHFATKIHIFKTFS